MNINNNINKLLFALSTIGQFYKINTFQFYSEKSCKYCTKYQILKKELIETYNENLEIEKKQKYTVQEEFYGKIEVMKYLAEEYRKGSETNG